MKKRLLYCISLAISCYSFGQPLPNRYLEETTPTYQINSGVTFSTAIPTIRTSDLFGNKLANEESYGQIRTTLKMDIYRPSNDNLTKKPVIIFAFGGGFVNGSRTEGSMRRLCEAYAKRGFVTATIDYRIGMNIGDEELSKRAVYRAIQDGRSAIRFFRKNAAVYGVDANQIFISGHSAGAFLALHCAFLDKDSERPASTRNFLGRLDLGGLDAIGDSKTFSDGTLVNGKPNGVLSFAGALGELTYIENSADVPTAYFHSSEDNTVPYNSGEPFSTLSWLPGFNLPIVYGSNQLNIRSGAVGANRTLFSYNNRGHGVHYTGSNLYSDIAPRGSQFLYDTKLKPGNVTISGNVSVCATCPAQTYTATNSAYYYDWQVTGGTFINRDPLSNTVTIQWNQNALVRNLQVTPYSLQLARGNATSINITTNQDPALTGSFTDIANYNDINLNKYFTDPEGETLTYKIVKPDVNPAALKADFNGSEIKNNILQLRGKSLSGEMVTIEVTDGSSCTTLYNLSVNSNQVLTSDILVTLSPNPVTDDSKVVIEGDFKGELTILIFDREGMKIDEWKTFKNDYKMTEDIGLKINKIGIYYVKIISENNTIVKSLIKN